MIRAVSDWSGQLREPFWASAKLWLPRQPRMLVVIAHHDERPRRQSLRKDIAEHLAGHQLACCAVRLTREDEHVAGRMVLDIETLADRFRGVVEFLANWQETCGLPLAVFGEDYCGAAAIIVAAEELPGVTAAGVYCGPTDLAEVHLSSVRVPTLLVVPGRDGELLARNERAFRKLECPSQIAVIGNATRGLRETGAVHACRYLIRRWCEQHAMRRKIPSHAY